MVRRWTLRVGGAACATAVLLAGAAASLAAIKGNYTGSGAAFTIGFQVTGAHVHGINIACGRGATTVAATGAAPKVKNLSFKYSGPASASNRSKSIHVTVTGTFFDKGKKVKGNAFSAGACPKGSYTASR